MELAADTTLVVVLVIVVVVIIAIALMAALQQQRRRRLHGRFGSEYDQTVEQAGGRRAGERELRDRVERHDELQLRPLDPDQSRRFRSEWEQVQAEFVDRPEHAAAEADELVEELLKQRGYPVREFEESSSLVSVDHPELVSNYREAHRITVETGRGRANTEQLRRALVAYRSLFDELLADATPQSGNGS